MILGPSLYAAITREVKLVGSEEETKMIYWTNQNDYIQENTGGFTSVDLLFNTQRLIHLIQWRITANIWLVPTFNEVVDIPIDAEDNPTLNLALL